MRFEKVMLVVLGLLAGLFVVVFLERKPETQGAPSVREPVEVPAGMARATFGAGCFWCTEAVFSELKGVESVVSGYCGGAEECPSYLQVCTGTTGHAEAVQITYDPAVISYEELLDVFWQTHDPTTRDRQGHDVGRQYRSVIFCHNAEQKRLAERSRQKLDASGQFSRPIVTEIVPFQEFYRAEAYHQNYFAEHPRQGYCQGVIRPKVEKVKKVFPDKLKVPPQK
jgi:peptide-methionine (S)-S-oxide reductase